MENKSGLDLRIWSCKDGPVNVEDLPEEDRPNDPDFQAYLVLMAAFPENLDDWFGIELWFSSFNDAYDYKNKVDRLPGPTSIGEI